MDTEMLMHSIYYMHAPVSTLWEQNTSMA